MTTEHGKHNTSAECWASVDRRWPSIGPTFCVYSPLWQRTTTDFWHVGVLRSHLVRTVSGCALTHLITATFTCIYVNEGKHLSTYWQRHLLQMHTTYIPQCYLKLLMITDDCFNPFKPLVYHCSLYFDLQWMRRARGEKIKKICSHCEIDFNIITNSYNSGSQIWANDLLKRELHTVK